MLAYIGLGSNLESPEKQLPRAMQTLQQLPDIQLLRSSSLYRSQPMGMAGQPDFVNAVAKISTDLYPMELLAILQEIEQQHQRVRTEERWGPRTLDLDILLYGDLQMHTKELQIPHPGISDREFVLIPLQEIEGDLVIPGKGSLRELIDKLPAYQLTKIATPDVGAQP
ncbi:MAG: 2-amino-4-hydroxy-6-hydroxymethyldihydropteridine diphosphokinase [Gammaproteobacteria bacterium]|nr:2-amino-4-hydroxy-6-hydroxymethyldihydropteridine diphosphokinase [Gammaproteobacteria bacterium]